MIFLTSGLTLVRNVDSNFGEIVVEQDMSFEGADSREVKTETLSFGLEAEWVDCSGTILEAFETEDIAIGDDIGVECMSFGDKESKLSIPLSWSVEMVPEIVKWKKNMVWHLRTESVHLFSPFMTSAHFQLANARLDVLIWHSGAESMHLEVFSFLSR